MNRYGPDHKISICVYFNTQKFLNIIQLIVVYEVMQKLILRMRKIRMNEEYRKPYKNGHEGGPTHIKAAYFNPKPVKVGDEVDVAIEASASGGDGVAKIDGFVVFVKGAKPKDNLKIRITDVRTRFAIGEPIS